MNLLFIIGTAPGTVGFTAPTHRVLRKIGFRERLMNFRRHPISLPTSISMHEQSWPSLHRLRPAHRAWMTFKDVHTFVSELLEEHQLNVQDEQFWTADALQPTVRALAPWVASFPMQGQGLRTLYPTYCFFFVFVTHYLRPALYPSLQRTGSKPGPVFLSFALLLTTWSRIGIGDPQFHPGRLLPQVRLWLSSLL